MWEESAIETIQMKCMMFSQKYNQNGFFFVRQGLFRTLIRKLMCLYSEWKRHQLCMLSTNSPTSPKHINWTYEWKSAIINIWLQMHSIYITFRIYRLMINFDNGNKIQNMMMLLLAMKHIQYGNVIWIRLELKIFISNSLFRWDIQWKFKFKWSAGPWEIRKRRQWLSLD